MDYSINTDERLSRTNNERMMKTRDTPFHRWPSIQNIPQQETSGTRINEYKQNIDKQYVLTEKVDGCNLSFLASRKDSGDFEYRICSRNGVINSSSKFMNGVGEKMFKQYLSTFKSLVEVMNNEDDLIHLQLYGELFGGIYQLQEHQFTEWKNRSTIPLEIISNKDGLVAFRNKGSHTMIPRVHYSPSNHFLAFGLCVGTKLNGKIKFYNYDQMKDILTQVNTKTSINPIMIIPDLGRGTLKDLVEISQGSIISPTDIPELYGLPKNSNLKIPREGFVFSSLDGNQHWKYKTNHFKEVENSKFTTEQKEELKIQTPPDHFRELAANYINDNRFISAISKIGIEVDEKTKGEYMKVMVEDACKDFFDDHNEITVKEKKHLKNLMFAVANKIIIEHISCTRKFRLKGRYIQS